MGRGIAKDAEKGLSFIELSAERGHSPAMMKLAYMNQEGIGTKQNASNALYWYQKAADSGVVQAWSKLAHFYRFGTMVLPQIRIRLWTTTSEVLKVETLKLPPL